MFPLYAKVRRNVGNSYQEWSEWLRETKSFYISKATDMKGRNICYRKPSGKRVNGIDYIVLDSIRDDIR